MWVGDDGREYYPKCRCTKSLPGGQLWQRLFRGVGGPVGIGLA